MGITIRDVAEASGVSTATVSRALRGLPNVDERTRARVQRIAAELDYVLPPSASRLASGRTGRIAPAHAATLAAQGYSPAQIDALALLGA